MPPRPNDRGASGSRLGTPLSAGEVAARQGSQSYDISSQGEEEDDFIGNDSEESLEGSWDSTGKDVPAPPQAPGEGGASSSPGDSDDGFIAQDTSSGADEYEGAYEQGAHGQGQRSSASGGDYDGQDDEFRDSEIERDGDDESELGQPAHGLQPEGERYEDGYDGDDGDDARGAKAALARAMPQSDHEDIPGAEDIAVENAYIFEEDSDEGSKGASKQQGQGSTCTGVRRDAVDGDGDGQPHGSSTAFIAQEYMQTRLSMHLLPVDGSEDDDEATPRLPSLSARAREREEEEKLLMLKAQEMAQPQKVDGVGEDDASTPRLEARSCPAQQGSADAQTPRLSYRPHSMGADVKGFLPQQDALEAATTHVVVHALINAGGDVPYDLLGIPPQQDALEAATTRVVVQALVDSGGVVPYDLMVEIHSFTSPAPAPGLAEDGDEQAEQEMNRGAEEPIHSHEVGTRPEDTEASRPDAGKVEHLVGVAVSDGPIPEAARMASTNAADDPSEAAAASARNESETLDKDISMTDTEFRHPEAALLNEEVGHTQRITKGNQELRVTEQGDEDLLTKVTAESYLFEERIESAASQPVTRRFAGYSTKLAASDGEEKPPSRPSSRSGSVCSTNKAQPLPNSRPITRIQERNARDIVREASGENSQELAKSLRERSHTESRTAEREDTFLGRPDWNFETVKAPKSLKERYHYEPPPVIEGSRWRRASGQASPEKSKDSIEGFSEDPRRQNSHGDVSGEASDTQPRDSRLTSSSFARAREYWATMVRTPGRRRKRPHGQQHRPATSLSSLSFEESSYETSANRPGTNDGYAARFRYNVQGSRGGAFGKGNPKSDVEWKIYDAQSKPAPGQYTVQRQDSTPSTGGKMLSKFDAVGSAQWESKKRGATPGPGHYDADLSERSNANGGRFTHSNRWQEKEVFEQRSRELPGPSEYDAGNARDRVHKRISGGAISDGMVMSELDWTLRRGSRTPGPSEYKLPPVEATTIRAKGGKVGREPRLQPVYTSAAENPGPGAYFSESTADKKKEVSLRRSKSRESVANNRSRASLGRERSQELAPKGRGSRRSFLDDVQTRASRLPGPGHYEGHYNTVSHKTSRQPLDRETVVSRPGASDPVVYSVGVAERSSIVSDYRTIQMLQQSWADSANEFKALLKSFIISTRAQPDLPASVSVQDDTTAADIPAAAADSLQLDEPLQGDVFVAQEANDERESVFITQG